MIIIVLVQLVQRIYPTETPKLAWNLLRIYYD